MIQRIQSIFLLLVAIAMCAIVSSNIWISVSETKTAVLTAMQLTITENGTAVVTANTIAIAVLAGLSGIVALGSLFSYKNRMNQMKLNLVNSILIFLVIGANLYYGYYQGTEMMDGVQGKYQIGFFLPVFAILFNSLANRFIQKDEKKVRDSISGRLRG